MDEQSHAKLTWRKSSRSVEGNNNCVEIAFDDDDVRMRDSKDPRGAILTFDKAAWTSFVEAIKAGELDH